MRRVAVLLVMMLAAAPLARAGDLILGASVGRSDLEGDAGPFDFEGEDIGWKAMVGFRFVEFLGIEGGYRDFGKPDGRVDGGGRAVKEVTAIDLYGVAAIPIRRVKLELFGKAGYTLWDADTVRPGNLVEAEDGVDFTWGLGVAWRLNEVFALRGEWETFQADGVDDLSFASVGFDLRF